MTAYESGPSGAGGATAYPLRLTGRYDPETSRWLWLVKVVLVIPHIVVLIGLVPFAAMGIAIGHLVSVDSLGPLMGGLTSILALLGGAWGPIATSGALHTVSEAMPSYWLVQAGKTAVGGSVWPLTGWLVIGVWSVAMAALAAWAYRRDTGKA